jgi:hypothetical protein
MSRYPMNFWESNPDKLAELPELSQRMTAGNIAKMWGVTRNTISGKMDRLGIKRPGAKPGPKPGPKPGMRSGRRQGVSATPFNRYLWRPPAVNSVIPCHRGQSCAWPACSQDCDGRPGRQMPCQAPTEAAERVFPHATDIWRLTDKSCRYPLWRDDEPISEKMYCADVAIEGLPYCAACARIAYRGER